MTEGSPESQYRCYPVKCCAECQGRLPMRHLYKPYGMMSHHDIVDVDTEFANRWVCTEKDDQEIKLHPSLDFPDWCPLKVITGDTAIAARQREPKIIQYPDCCKYCDELTPLCHESCGKYRVEHDTAIAQAAREDERKKYLAELKQGRKVITLCGSVKFWDEYILQNAILTLEGNIVFSCGLSLKEGYEDLICDLPLDDVKTDLDFIHLRKIDLSDEIFVLNVGGYIGDSTKREIAYATARGKAVRYLEPLRATTPASGNRPYSPTDARNCPGKWPWSCSKCPENLKRGCIQRGCTGNRLEPEKKEGE